MHGTTTTLATDPIWFIDNLARVHVDGEQTGGRLGLVELAGRKGDMPPLHVHRREDELFYVLEGRMTVFLPGEQIELGAGSAVFAPRDVPHAYRVESDTARWLALASPAGFERFVREAGVPAENDELPSVDRVHDVEELARIAGEYGIELLGHPGMLP